MQTGWQMARRWGMALAGVMAVTGCTARRDFPQTQAGWHSPGYGVVFGRLEKTAGATEDSPPLWTVRFGSPQDAYGGQFALTPPERMTGYIGGERVEVRGHLRTEADPGPNLGSQYVVDSLQMWSGYH